MPDFPASEGRVTWHATTTTNDARQQESDCPTSPAAGLALKRRRGHKLSRPNDTGRALGRQVVGPDSTRCAEGPRGGPPPFRRTILHATPLH
eukprot:9080079-Lingulodinium_polyedra.AAC.1